MEITRTELAALATGVMALTEAVSGCSGLKECERVEIPGIASSGEDFCYNGEWRNGMVPDRTGV